MPQVILKTNFKRKVTAKIKQRQLRRTEKILLKGIVKNKMDWINRRVRNLKQGRKKEK